MTITDEERQRAGAWLRGRAGAFAQKLAPLYRQLNWRWLNAVEIEMVLSGHVPSAAEIEVVLHSLIDDCVAAGGRSICGGLAVRILKDANGHVEAGINWIVDDSNWDV